jgi:ABC-type branched-subunit amino acid transport system ATPase component/ABC-type branched-subunit amino acid transport system permease subunit
MRLYAYLIGAVVIAVYPAVAPNAFFLQIAQDVCIGAIAVIGLNLLLGLSGQMSIGQAGFFALGAYGSGILATTHGWPLWLTIPIGVVVPGIAGIGLGLIALRARTHYLAMATLAFGFIVEILAQRWVGLTGGSMGLIGVPQLFYGDFARGPMYFFWTVGGAFLLVQLLNDYVMDSRDGRILRAIQESESFALTVGVNAPLWRAGVFVVSAALAGLSGVFFVHQSGYVSSDAFGLDRSINLLIAAVIGGLGHAYGPLLGSIILVLLNQLTAGLYEVAAFLYGGILLSVMLFFPGGAGGALTAFVQLFCRRVPHRAFETVAAGNLGIVDRPPVHEDTPALELAGLVKRYAGVTAVEDVSFAVRPGTVHALIGPNGAGKSTLINVVAGLYTADGGRIELFGHPVTSLSAWQRARLGLARTFQNLQLIGGLTAAENVMLALPRSGGFLTGLASWLGRGRRQAEERAAAVGFLRALGIAEQADLLPGQLSFGQRKLVELARALAQRPSMMLLDEPIAGLNEEEAREIADAVAELRRLGVTVLLVEHNMQFVMGVSDMVTVLDYGRRISEGTPAEVQRDPVVIGAYLGTEEVLA